MAFKKNNPGCCPCDTGPPPGTVALPGCNCAATPVGLTMDSVVPTCDGGLFHDCTIQYGPTPSGYAALSLGSSSFLSVESFQDDFGDTFRYYFTCNTTNFTITRVYLTSFFGSPFKDIVRYTWTLGAVGNTCVPFLLSNGFIYSGGDINCNVDISG